LEQSYSKALKKVQEALKKADNPDARRLLNEAHKAKSSVKKKEEEIPKDLKVGDTIKYRNKIGTIISLKSKEAMIEIDGMRLRVPKSQLKVAKNVKVKPKRTNVTVRVEKPSSSKMVLKLLGKRADEAQEELQDFLSKALLSGFNEVEIIHGTGGGVLIKGNMGATIVKL